MLILGDPLLLVQQDDDEKQRYFYRIIGVSGSLKETGNGLDVKRAAYFEASNLPEGSLAPGVETIVDMVL